MVWAASSRASEGEWDAARRHARLPGVTPLRRGGRRVEAARPTLCWGWSGDGRPARPQPTRAEPPPPRPWTARSRRPDGRVDHDPERWAEADRGSRGARDVSPPRAWGHAR